MKLNIMSANIRFDNPRDKEHSWPNRRAIMSEVINSLSPDLLGTQEGLRPQLKDLDGLIPYLQLADDHRDWISNRMYPCIFYNPQKIHILKSGDFWLSETPQIAASKSFESAFPRLCTWVEAIHVLNGQKFIYANTHLDHLKGETRKEQARVLLEEIEKVNSENLPLVITGDFNESPTDSVRAHFNEKKPSLSDAWIQLGLEEETTHHSFKGYREDGTRIDWILTDSFLKPESIKAVKTKKDGIYPSDHFPIFGSYSL